MPLILSAIPWRLIAALGIAVGLLLGAMYVAGQLKQIGKLETQLDSAIEVSNQNAAIAEQYRKDMEDLQKKVAAGAKKKEGIRAEADKRRKDIINALPEDDGPLAPVLRSTLDGLRPDPHTNEARAGS